VQNEIFLAQNIMMQCRDFQSLHNSRDLERQRGRMQHRGMQGWGEKRWGTGWQWRPNSCEQLTRGQLKKCRPGPGQS